MRSHEFITETPIPTKTIDVVYHVGTLNPKDKRTGSFEGSGLSVSTHPDEWRRIARGHVSGSTYRLTKIDSKFIDAHMLTDEHMKIIAEWAVSQNLIVPQEIIRVRYFDDELDSEVHQDFSSMDDAIREYPDIESYDVEINKTGYVPTDLLKTKTRNPRMTPTAVIDYVLPLYAEFKNYDGVWWEDKLDVSKFSAPRGVIVPQKVKTWNTSKISN